MLVDVLTKVCDDHCIKSSHTNGVSETSTDHGPPDIGDEKSIVDGWYCYSGTVTCDLFIYSFTIPKVFTHV